MADLNIAVQMSGRDTGAQAVISRAQQTLAGLRSAAAETTGVMGRLWSSMETGIGIAAGFAVFQAGGRALEYARDAAIGFNQTLDGARATMSRYFTDQQSLNNSIEHLNDLAAKTPFAFEGLLVAQQRTIGAARSAQELKENMDAITVVAANTGRVGTQNMERISLALGQMTAKGKLAGGELLQLTEAGVNMAEIITKHLGISTAEMYKMMEAGQLKSSMVWEAMRKEATDPRNREALEKMEKTWAGSWAAINDIARKVIADTFRPLFDLLTEGAIAFKAFLQTDEFKAWAETLRLSFVGISEAVKSTITSLAPLGQAIATAFGQATGGDFGGAFATLRDGFGTVLGQITQDIGAFAQEMFGAGANLIGEFASGMLEGGIAAVQAAIDTVASIIASFLIGASPPPEGPLSTIDEGGRTLMETYGMGMQSGLGPAKAAVEQIDDAIRGLNSSIAEIDFEQTSIRRTVQDIKQEYEDMIDPLKEQLELIERKRGEGEKELKLRFQERELALREAELLAKGDPVRRAELMGELERIKQRQKELGLADSLADIEEQKRKLQKDGTKGQLDDLKYTRQREDLERRLKDAKDKGQKESILRQIEELDLRRKMDKEDTRNDKEDAKRKLAQLELRQKELEKEQELAALVDKGQLAAIAKEKELLGLDKERAEIAQRYNDIGSDAARQEVLDRIRAIKDEETARLRPLEDQQRLLQRQKDDLEEVRKRLQLQKQELNDIVQVYQKAERERKASEKAAKEAAKSAQVPGRPAGGISFDIDEAQKKAKEKIVEMGAGLSAALADSIRNNAPTLVASAFGFVLGGIVAGPVGAVFGAALVPKLWEAVNEKLKEAGFDASPVLAEIIAGIRDGDWTRVGDALLSGFKGVWNALFKPETDIDEGGIAVRAAKWVGDKLALIPWDQVGKTLRAGWDKAWTFLFGEGANVDQGAQGGQSGSTGLTTKIQDAVGNAVAAVNWVDVWARAQNMGTTFRNEFFKQVGSAFTSVAQTDMSGVGEAIGYWFTRVVIDVVSAIGEEISRILFGGIQRWFIRTFTDEEPGPETQSAVVTFLVGILKGAVAAIAEDPWDAVNALLTIVFAPARWTKALLGMVGKVPIAGPIIKWIGDALLDVGKFFRGGKRDPITTLWDDVLVPLAKELPDRLGKALKTVIEPTKKALAAPFKEVFDPKVARDDMINWVDGLLEGFRYRIPQVTDAITDWAKDVIRIVRFWWGMRSPSQVMHDIGIDFVQGFMDGVSATLDAANTHVETFAQGVIDAVNTYVGGPVMWLVDTGKQMLEGFQNGVQSFWDTTLKPWLEGAGDWVTTAFNAFKQGPVKWLVDTGKEVLNGLQTGVDDHWNRGGIRAWFEGAGDWVIQAVRHYAGGPVNWLVQTGTDIWSGLQTGIQNAQEGFKRFLEGIINSIPSMIRSLLNLDADAGPLARVGERMVRELEIGIENRMPSLEALLGRLGGRLQRAMRTGWNLDDDMVADYIRERAPHYGIPAEHALAVWNNEGRSAYAGDYNTNGTPSSFGPYQLHFGGLGEPHSASGMGDSLLRSRGINAMDPSTWKDQIDYVFESVRNNGWGPFHGAPDWLRDVTGYKQGGLISEDIFGVGRSGRRYMFHGAPGKPEAVLDAATTAALRNGKGGGSAEHMANVLAERLGPMIARTRPIVQVGTAEQLERKVRRELAQQRRIDEHHRGVRT